MLWGPAALGVMSNLSAKVVGNLVKEIDVKREKN